MNLKQVIKIISESSSKELLSSVNLEVTISWSKFNATFEGLVDYYKFISDQVALFNKYTIVNNSLLSPSKRAYEQVQKSLDNFLEPLRSQPSLNPTSHYSSHKSGFQPGQLNRENIILADQATIEFILSLESIGQTTAKNAWNLIHDRRVNMSSTSLESISGVLLAYEFVNPDSTISKRSKLERRSIKRLKSDLTKTTDTLGQIVTNKVTEINDQVELHKQEIEKYREDSLSKIENLHSVQENDFKTLLSSKEEELVKLVQESEERLKIKEAQYSELLKLKEPAAYWRRRASELNSEARAYIGIMMICILSIGVALYSILSSGTEGMLESFKSGNSSAISWSITLIALLSTGAYALRIFSRLAFSTFHLARDAEEREKLIFVYLSLLNDSEVDKESRLLVMQSIFSRADSGLLKEDSGPTMPSSNVLDKLIRP
ncbi:MAG: DUF6161 domain-containing protein [Bacteroidota bacterium]